MIIIRYRYYFISLISLWVIFLFFLILQGSHSYADVELGTDITETNNSSLYWIIFFIGGIILVALTYVSLRKFFGQKHRHKNKSKDRLQ